VDRTRNPFFPGAGPIRWVQITDFFESLGLMEALDAGPSHELELDLSLEGGFVVGRREVADR
jgi:hypothetical protein